MIRPGLPPSWPLIGPKRSETLEEFIHSKIDHDAVYCIFEDISDFIVKIQNGKLTKCSFDEKLTDQKSWNIYALILHVKIGHFREEYRLDHHKTKSFLGISAEMWLRRQDAASWY